MSRGGETASAPVSKVMNPVQTALEWKRMLAEDGTLTKAKIAGNMGISRARVTQIMNLLTLPEEVLNHVAPLTDRRELRVFTERHLRQILAIQGSAARLTAFTVLRQRAAC
jgi:ParB-like chromosome segregation protein Spo0J